MPNTIRFAKDETVSHGDLETIGECATAIKSHVDTCNGYRDLWLKIAGVLIAYMIVISTFVGTTLIDQDQRIDDIKSAHDADKLAITQSIHAAIERMSATQIADRAQFQQAITALNQNTTDRIGTVTVAQIDRTKQLSDSMAKSDSMTRDELKAIRDEIGQLRNRIEAFVMQQRR